MRDTADSGAGGLLGRLTLLAARQDAVGELVHVLTPAKGDSRRGWWGGG